MSEKAAVWEDINVLVPWSDNPRHNQSAIQSVADSIKRFGFASPIIAREADKMIIAGHTRLAAAKSLGLDRVPVRYLDLDPADAKMLALADNKIGEIADWDEAALEKIIDELSLSADDMADLGWSASELDDLFESDFDAVDEEPVHVDEDSEPVSKPGEIYNLGDHRLLCGDSTKEESWQELMGSDEVCMVFTDPPYGMNYGGGRTDKFSMIKNDDAQGDDLEMLARAPLLFAKSFGCCTAYVCLTWRFYSLFEHAIESAGYKIRSCIVWDKGHFGLGHQDYRPQHEFVFYCGGGDFYGGRDQSDVWSIKRDSVSQYSHPTQKPVSLITRALLNSSQRGNIVADAFGGSGSTLIACAETGRRARLIELDPKYCDVIRRRWFKYATEHNLDIGDGLDG